MSPLLSILLCSISFATMQSVSPVDIAPGGPHHPQLPVEVELVEPPGGQLYVESLWRVRLFNTSSETFSVYLFVTIEESSLGLLMEATTASFILPPGMMPMSSADLSPINTEFYNSSFESSVGIMGGFPDGIYNVNISVYEDGGGILGSGSFIQDVTNHSDPVLQYPLDQTMVMESCPVFTWIPTLPATDVTYTFRLVEVLGGQSPASAITANPAVLEQNDLTGESFAYPVYADALQPGINYGWQVKAYYMGTAAGCSEVWSFQVSGGTDAEEDGTGLWQMETGDRVTCSPALTPEENVICGGRDGFIYVVDPLGSLLWSYSAGGSVHSVTLGPQNRIYATGAFGICCMDPAGMLLWRTSVTGRILSCPAVPEEGPLFTCSEEGILFALDRETGAILDTLDLENRVHLPPAMDAGGRIFAADGGGDLLCAVYGDDGLQREWEFGTGETFTGGPVVHGGRIYGAAGREIQCFTPEGRQLWRSVLPSHVYAGPVISDRNVLYAATGSGNIYVLDSSGGERAGVVAAGAVITSTPALNAAGEMIFGCEDGILRCMSSAGLELWSFETGGAVRSSPVLGMDGTVYFGSDDQHIYAVAGGTGPMLRGWPKFCLNSGNNGVRTEVEEGE